jgi:hypothetical protein
MRSGRRDDFLGRLVRDTGLPADDAALVRARELAHGEAATAPRGTSGSRRLVRAALAFTAVALAAGLAGGFIGARTGESTASVAPPVLAFDVAAGWSSLQTHLPPPAGDKVQIAWTANVPFAGDDAATGFPLETAKSLPPDGVVVYASSAAGVANPDEYRELELPLTLADGRFVSEDYENQPAPHVSMSTIGARLDGGYVLVHVWFGANEPSPAARKAAEAALSRLRVPEFG